MASESNPNAEDRMYDLLDLTTDALLARVRSAGTDEDHPPLSAAEIAVIATLLKNNGISTSGAKNRGGKMLALKKELPKFEENDELEPVRGRG